MIKKMMMMPLIAINVAAPITINAKEYKVKDYIQENYGGKFNFLNEDESIQNPDFGKDRKNEIMYQIFPASFADSNNDGMGDLNGITERIGYLNDLNIDSVWLNPIFKSDSNHRYDATDFYKVDDELGTMKDFENLIKKMHDNNKKVYLDLIPNHFSYNHPLFQQWLKDAKNNKLIEDKNDYFRGMPIDFYKGTEQTPDKKWIHIPGTPYTKEELKPGQINAFYSSFEYAGMPDVNFESKAMVDELLNIGKFWIEKGVDGFRLDAVPHILDYKSIGTNAIEYWPDVVVKEHNYEIANRFFRYFTNKLKKIKPDLYVFGENLTGDTKMIERLGGGMNQFDAPLFYELFENLYKNKWEAVHNSYKIVDDINKLNKNIRKFQNPKHETLISFISSHDQNRIASSLAKNLDKKEEVMASIFAIQLSLPDQPVIYYGDELGLMGIKPNGANNDRQRRLPMPWSFNGRVTINSDKSRGEYDDLSHNQIPETIFGRKDIPAYDAAGSNALFAKVSAMIRWRKEHKEIFNGKFEHYGVQQDLHVVSFSYMVGNKRYVFVHNTTGRKIPIDFGTHQFAPKNYESLTHHFWNKPPLKFTKRNLNNQKVDLGPWESAVFYE